MRVTSRDIEYRSAPYGIVGRIPAGTAVIPSTNLPFPDSLNSFWVEPWDGMSETEESWCRMYGYLVPIEDTERVVWS